MEEWLKQSGFFIGNAILSGMGLAFALGAPATAKYKSAKKWWIILWASLVGFYLWFVSVYAFSARNIFALIGLSIFDGISTAATAMLYFHLRDKWRLKTQRSIIVFCVVFLLAMLSHLLTNITYSSASVLAGFTNRIIAWIFFILLAWNYRKKHMPTTIFLLAYANLQLPAGLIGKEGLGNDFVLLLATKLSLIGAMYHTLGIRDTRE